MLYLTITQIRTLCTQLERVYPEEGCGVLLGQGNTVTRVEPLENVALEGREHRYQVAPDDLVRLQHRERITGEQILGFYHSHPDSPAIPSPTDLERAWEGWVYLIVSVEEGKAGERRAWEMDEAGNAFVEAQLVTNMGEMGCGGDEIWR